MTVISTSNSIALAILKGPGAAKWVDGDTFLKTAKTAERMFGRNLLLPSNDAMKQAAGKIAEIINLAARDRAASTGQNGSVTAATKTYTSYQDGYDPTVDGPFGVHSATGAPITSRDNMIFQGGDGDDRFQAWDNAKVATGKGDDVIDVQNNATVESGDGNDTVFATANASVTTGDGDDFVQVAAHSVIDSGAGNDTVKAHSYSQISGGAGDDELRAYDHVIIDAGDGDDLAVVLGYSTVKGGAGNDTLIDSEINNDPNAVYGHSVIDGGEGDDYIQATVNSTVIGGAGNDVIRLTNKGSTVIFNKGDGQDVITSREDLTLKIGGYRKDDVIVTKDGDISILSFKGSDEAIQMNLVFGATAHLSFEDGSTLNVRGIEQNKALNEIVANPDIDPQSNTHFYFRQDSSTRTR